MSNYSFELSAGDFRKFQSNLSRNWISLGCETCGALLRVCPPLPSTITFHVTEALFYSRNESLGSSAPQTAIHCACFANNQHYSEAAEDTFTIALPAPIPAGGKTFNENSSLPDNCLIN